MKTLSHLLFVFMLLIILTACSAANPTNNTTSFPTQSSGSVSETEEWERPPTVTARPSSTPSLSATADQTQTAIYQDNAAAQSAQSAEQTVIAQYPRICRNSYASPNYSPNKL